MPKSRVCWNSEQASFSSSGGKRRARARKAVVLVVSGVGG